MSYIINKTTGEVLITILDGTADGPLINPGQNVSDVNLFGKNFPLFGDKLDENFITLLQNSANKTAPTTPLQGELWYDLNTGFLKIYTGTIWTPVSPVIVANTAPSTTVVGAQWWDTTNYQLNSWNGGAWTLIGPAYKNPDGKSGAIVQDVADTVGGSHTIIAFYNNNNIVAVSSYDPSFTLSPLNPIPGFSVISPGFTLATGVANNLFYGTATNSQMLGNVVAANYARTDIIPTFTNNVFIAGGNISIDSAPNGTARYYNTVLNGNLSLFVNKGGALTNAIKVTGLDGSTNISGALTISSSLTAYGVTSTGATGTGQLVFSASPTITGTLTAQNVTFNGNLSTTGNLSINGSIFSVNGTTGDTVIAGNLTLGRFSNITLYGVTSTGATGTGGVVFNSSPVLAGAPTTSNVANSADNTANIASTAFVQNAITYSTTAPWQSSHKFVSSSAPTSGDGNVGDFWFQI